MLGNHKLRFRRVVVFMVVVVLYDKGNENIWIVQGKKDKKSQVT